MLKTYLIVHPDMETLKLAMNAAGIDASGSDADICARQATRDWLLGELTANNMKAPVWKGYEVAANLILDPEEWTTDNDMMTPSMKVKLRNLLAHHEAEIANIQG